MSEYEEVKREGEASVGEYRETHPAFGTVQISRIQCGGKISLFGSRTKVHPTLIRLRIARASRQHGLSRDWIFSGLRNNVVEVDMTALQFSDMLTHMNMGEGVPCTLRYIDGKPVPHIPMDEENELGRIIEASKKDVAENLKENRLPSLKKAIHEMLDSKGALKASDKKKLKGLLFEVVRVVEDHLPHAMKSYGAAAEKIQTEVKKEIAAFTQMVVEKAGMKAIGDMDAEEQTKLLTGGGDD